MRRPNNANKFISKLAKRERKVAVLQGQRTPESRKQLKQMHTINVGKRQHVSVKGYYVPRVDSPRPCKCSVKSKTRHTTRAAKAIMSGR